MEGDLNNPECYGIIPRSAEYIFNALSKPEYVSHAFSISCLEIYNEELRDLLVDQENLAPIQSPVKGSRLEIMEGKDGVFCRGLTNIQVHSTEDVLNAMKTAQTHRRVGETKLNLKSSRSHCVFTMHITAQKKLDDGRIFDSRGKLHLVDLAGSECAKAAALDKSDEKKDTSNRKKTSFDEANRERGRERGNINRSLLTLGRVILMLNQRSNKKTPNVRIPYRDSKLTRMLQDSLGGRCLTQIIATISPSEKAIEETISTLHYAQSANGIRNKPVSVSFMKSPNSRCNTPMNESADTKGIEHWYEMEMQMKYLQAQLDEAQAELARQYDGHKDVIQKAELFEEELLKVTGVLEKTQGDLKNSVIMLKKSEQVILAQQKELERTKVEHQRMKRHFVNNVMGGVTELVNTHMNRLSIKQNENFEKMKESNCAFSRSTEELRTSASNILIEVTKNNQSILESSNDKRVSDRKMILGTKLTNDTMRDLDKMWNRQRKLVDDFVIQGNQKVRSFTNHEMTVVSTCSAMKNERDDTSGYINENLQCAMNDGVRNLSNVVQQQRNYVENSVLTSTKNRLDEMERDHSNVAGDFAAITSGLSNKLFEDKENMIKITEKQCSIADDLRIDVEKKYDGFGNVLAKQRRININARKAKMIRSLKDFHEKSNGTIGAMSEKESSVAKANVDRFANTTLRNWNSVKPVDERKQVDYCRELTSTPSDEMILKPFEESTAGARYKRLSAIAKS